MKLMKSVQMAGLAVLFAFTFNAPASASTTVQVPGMGAIADETPAAESLLLADKGQSAETEKGEGSGKGKGSEMGKGEGLDKPKGEGSGSDDDHGKEGDEGHGESHGKKDH